MRRSLLQNVFVQLAFIERRGALNQQDWSTTEFLLPRVVIVWLLAFLMQRPMTLLGLDDGIAKNLGLGLSAARFTVLSLAIFLSAQLVNAVGIIGFIGLFAPLLARILGARRLISKLILAPLTGALLLWLTDQIVLWLSGVWTEISTAATPAVAATAVGRSIICV